MKENSKSTTTSSAFGTALDTPIPYDYKWTTFESDEEFVAAKAELTIEEQRKVVNTKRESNARSKAMTAKLILMGYEKPNIQNNELLRLKTVYDGIMASKLHTEEKAREIASMATGVAWPDGDE
jgi:hypothetical protein